MGRRADGDRRSHRSLLDDLCRFSRRDGAGNRRRRGTGSQPADICRVPRVTFTARAGHPSLSTGKRGNRTSGSACAMARQHPRRLDMGHGRRGAGDRRPLFDRLESQVSGIVVGSGKEDVEKKSSAMEDFLNKRRETRYIHISHLFFRISFHPLYVKIND